MATTANNFKTLLTSLIVSLLLFSLFGLFGKQYWFFDLFSHFSLQYFFLSLCFAFLLFIFNRTNYVLWLFVFPTVLINLQNLWPFYSFDAYTRNIASSPLKIVSINLNSANQQIDLLKDYLKKYNPDVVFMMELTPSIGSQLRELKTQFPYGKAVMENGNFGIGIISKLPLDSVEIHRQASSRIPYISAKILVVNQMIGLVAVHPFPPIGEQGTLLRNDYTDQISQLIKNNKIPTILCGDWNASPWSYQTKKIINETETKIPKGHGIITTWPSSLPFLKIPIDFCLTSKSIGIMEYSRGPYVGSDHYPYQMEVDTSLN